MSACRQVEVALRCRKASGWFYICSLRAALCVCSTGTNILTLARWIPHPSVEQDLQGQPIWVEKERRFKREDVCCC